MNTGKNSNGKKKHLKKNRRKMREALKVWIRNEKQIEEAIINGEKVEVVKSGFVKY